MGSVIWDGDIRGRDRNRGRPSSTSPLQPELFPEVLPAFLVLIIWRLPGSENRGGASSVEGADPVRHPRHAQVCAADGVQCCVSFLKQQ
ncbi:hypothetical protein SLEP1_g12457 [Rubroshorea leprosula]|uniref:Uncharacterized protein n=1 Tax=Rubroshorea leprosula TaxID=152421 RepID=A0AAV5IKK7_9ROSI|nr:hypothetical protein SLEP1_g12457 [Rubroshorea leprosula]